MYTIYTYMYIDSSVRLYAHIYTQFKFIYFYLLKFIIPVRYCYNHVGI